ncbi:MAG: hypothetical protein ACLQU3_28030 [Limisphaerales bacterium]
MTDNRREEIRRAAVALAKLPRGVKRKLSGFAGTTRLWRGRPIMVAGSMPAYAFGARRQKVVFYLDADYRMEPGRWGVLRANLVEIIRNPAAVLLGQSKRGVRERHSALKAATARRNGAMPARRGPRGRPPRTR